MPEQPIPPTAGQIRTTASPSPSFDAVLTEHERDQADARAATAEAERDDALDDLAKARGQLAEAYAAGARSATEADNLRERVDRAEQERNEALSELTKAWGALNRAGISDPIAGAGELIDRLAAERDRWRANASAYLQWRDHTAAVASKLVDTIHGQGTTAGPGDLHDATNRMRDVLTLDPEKTYSQPLAAASPVFPGSSRRAQDAITPRIVVLCGSTRFRTEIADANRRFTLDGYIVLAPGVFGHDGDQVTDEQKEALDDLHFRKIDLADEVYVVNPDGYIGESTRLEMSYARRTGKPVRRLVENTVTLPTYGDDAPATLRSRP